jgi:hypothetical protein
MPQPGHWRGDMQAQPVERAAVRRGEDLSGSDGTTVTG